MNGIARQKPAAAPVGLGPPTNVAIAIGLTTLFAVAMTGGSSRPDAVQAIALQPLAILGAMAAFLTMRRGDLNPYRVPLTILAAFAALVLLQIVPLPHALWAALPGRDVYAAMDAAGSLNGARPLSLVPWRTVNALTSLGVPLAALVVYASWRERAPRIAVGALLGIAAIGAVLGFLQVANGGDDALYFYAVTNLGAQVGFLANQNHAAILQAIALVAALELATRHDRSLGHGWRIALYAVALLIFVSCLTNGSRIGLVALVIALLAGLALFLVDRKDAAKTRPASRMVSGRLAWAAAAGLAVVLLAALFWQSDRLPGLSRLLEEDSLGDMRLRTLPVVGEMIAAFWLPGAGLGSFDAVYRSFEPLALLRPEYLNQAHNDVLQFVIECGLAGVLLVLALAGWAVRSLHRLWTAGDRHRRFAIAGAAALAILLFGSLTDYPLRTGLVQWFAVWVVAFIAGCADRVSRDDGAGFQTLSERL